MSLRNKLSAIRAGARSMIPPEKMAVMERATETLRESGILSAVIRPGQVLPPFALAGASGQTVRSETLLGAGPLIITVFRGQW